MKAKLKLYNSVKPYTTIQAVGSLKEGTTLPLSCLHIPPLHPSFIPPPFTISFLPFSPVEIPFKCFEGEQMS